MAEVPATPTRAAALRVRQRFSGFYDLKVRQDANEHDIDSSQFNSESYVQTVRRTHPRVVTWATALGRQGRTERVRRPPRGPVYSDETRWQVLKAKSLPELVQRSNELSTEIKELDSDMQMLVYENYNKFISATETIQDMKTKVDGMEGEMGRLATAVSEITGGMSRVLGCGMRRRACVGRRLGSRI